MKIEIVYPGRIKNSFAKDGFEEYIRRCNRFHKVNVFSFPSRSSEREKTIKEESKKLMKYLANKEYVLLDVNGMEKTTKEFAEMVSEHLDRGNDLVFVVGGVFGVSEEVKSGAVLKLSLSKLTFTHSLSLLILAEQLYRTMKILSGQPYDH